MVAILKVNNFAFLHLFCFSPPPSLFGEKEPWDLEIQTIRRSSIPSVILMDSIQTLHDCCLGPSGVPIGRWLTLTYFQGHRGHSVCPVKVFQNVNILCNFLMASIQTLHDCCLGPSGVQKGRWLTMTYLQGHGGHILT